jgi:succinate-semialdehyde dehydrogenase
VFFTADDEEQVQKFRDVVFPGGYLNKDCGRKSQPRRWVQDGGRRGARDGARDSAAMRRDRVRKTYLAKEKLCPVVAILTFKTFEEAVAKAKANLLVEGAGHSAAVHSNSEENIRYAGTELPISRLVVNQACAGDCRRLADQRVCARRLRWGAGLGAAIPFPRIWTTSI